jgi:hypothetical protein
VQACPKRCSNFPFLEACDASIFRWVVPFPELISSFWGTPSVGYQLFETELFIFVLLLLHINSLGRIQNKHFEFQIRLVDMYNKNTQLRNVFACALRVCRIHKLLKYQTIRQQHRNYPNRPIGIEF